MFQNLKAMVRGFLHFNWSYAIDHRVHQSNRYEMGASLEMGDGGFLDNFVVERFKNDVCH